MILPPVAAALRATFWGDYDRAPGFGLIAGALAGLVAGFRSGSLSRLLVLPWVGVCAGWFDLVACYALHCQPALPDPVAALFPAWGLFAALVVSFPGRDARRTAWTLAAAMGADLAGRVLGLWGVGLSWGQGLPAELVSYAPPVAALCLLAPTRGDLSPAVPSPSPRRISTPWVAGLLAGAALVGLWLIPWRFQAEVRALPTPATPVNVTATTIAEWDLGTLDRLAEAAFIDLGLGPPLAPGSRRWRLRAPSLGGAPERGIGYMPFEVGFLRSKAIALSALGLPEVRPEFAAGVQVLEEPYLATGDLVLCVPTPAGLFRRLVQAARVDLHADRARAVAALEAMEYRLVRADFEEFKAILDRFLLAVGARPE